jgi:hypothetical protein
LALMPINMFMVAPGRDIGHTPSYVLFVTPCDSPQGDCRCRLLAGPPTGGLEDRLLFRS